MLCSKMRHFCTLRTISICCRSFYQNCSKEKHTSSDLFKTTTKPIHHPILSENSKVQHTRFLFSDSSQTAKKQENQLVYLGPLKERIKIVKIFSLSSSAIGFAMQPYIIYSMSQISLIAAAGVAVISTMFLITPFLLHFITKRYVIELYFDNNTRIFTAKTLTLINKIHEIKYTANDVSVPTLPGILSSFHVKDTPLFVDRRLVEDPDAYEHMMGLDKPFESLIKDEDDEKK